MLANVSLSHTQHRTAASAVSRPNLTDKPDDFQSELLEGFIQHPKRFPLKFRRLRFWQSSKLELNEDSKTGLTFSSKEYQKPGSIIEVTIPTRKEVHNFLGKVVMVKESDENYEIGIWLINVEDAPKLRIVEQICHIELYLNDKRYKEGPFLSQEKLTEEWITRFASGFPVS
jgi:hypothetical protein